MSGSIVDPEEKSEHSQLWDARSLSSYNPSQRSRGAESSQRSRQSHGGSQRSQDELLLSEGAAPTYGGEKSSWKGSSVGSGRSQRQGTNDGVGGSFGEGSSRSGGSYRSRGRVQDQAPGNHGAEGQQYKSPGTSLHDSFHDGSYVSGGSRQGGDAQSDQGGGSQGSGTRPAENNIPEETSGPRSIYSEEGSLQGSQTGSRYSEQGSKAQSQARSRRSGSKRGSQAGSRHSDEDAGSRTWSQPLQSEATASGSENGEVNSQNSDPLRDEKSTGGGTRTSNFQYEIATAAEEKSVKTEGSSIPDDAENVLQEGDRVDQDVLAEASVGSMSNISGFEDFEFDGDKAKTLEQNSIASEPAIDQVDEASTVDLLEHFDEDGSVGDEKDGQERNLLDDEDKKFQDSNDASDGEGAAVPFAENESLLSGDDKDQNMTGNSKGLPENMFSFMISSTATKPPFIAALLLVFFKLIFFFMLIADLTTADDATKGNAFGVPASIAWPLATTQFFALSIAVVVQNDLIQGLTLWREGYYKDTDFALIQEGFHGDGIGLAFGGTSKNKWIATIFWLYLTGITSLVTTFLLVVTSSDVSELLLTFSVVSFISQLDKAFFVLAKNDFLGSSLRDEARTITITTYQVPTQKKRSLLRTLMLLISLLFLLCGWAYILSQQSMGRYLPQNIIIQFDDSNSPDLGYLSGLYTIKSSPVSYVKGEAILMYCKSKRFWTLRNGGSDPCSNILARSSETRVDDVTRTMQMDWFALTKQSKGRAVLISSFFIGVGCSSDEDCGGINKGTCNKNACSCKSSFYGLRCDFEVIDTCPVLDIDVRTTQFRSSRTLSSSYKLLRSANGKLVQAYSHPVYTSSNSFGEVDIILYSGLRWVITNADKLVGLADRSIASAAPYFEGSQFDASNSLMGFDQVSSVARFDTKSDQASPVDLSWSPSLVSVPSVGMSETKLMCKACNAVTNPCLNQGTCSAAGTCECSFGATGDLCQIVPTGNGRCDPFFNTAFYNFDEGDCCSSSCISSHGFRCGEVASMTGEVALYAGFPLCQDSAARGCDASQICWSTRAGNISLLTSGGNSFLFLASNGMTLVISEPMLNTIRVFDQVDQRWVIRGEALQSNLPTELGGRVALSAGSKGLITRRVGRVPIVLAASMSTQGGPSVRIWQWGAHDVTWQQVCDDVLLDCSLDDCAVSSISVGKQGNRGVLGVGLSTGDVSVFEILFAQSRCELKWTTTGSFVRISGNGARLALSSFSDSSQSADFAVFDLPPNLPVGFTVKLNFDSGENLLSESYRESLTTRKLAQEPSLALAHDGRILNLALTESDASVTIDTLSITKETSQFEVRSSTDTGVSAAILTNRVEMGLSTVAFSNDASGVGIKGTDGSTRVFHFFEDMREMPWHPGPADFQASSLETDFAVSRNGRMIASGNAITAEVFGASKGCNTGEAEIRVAITLDENPFAVSWYLELIQVVDDNLVYANRTIVGCQGCYDQAFSGGIVVQEVCILENLVNCVRLSLRSEEAFSQGAGITAFVNGEEFMTYNGDSGNSDFFVASGPALAADCPAEGSIFEADFSDCDNGETALIGFLTFDANPEEVKWTLRSIDTNLQLASSKVYTSEHAFSTVTTGICVPSDSECLLFTITDSQGDGLCCNYGFGDLVLYLGGEQVYIPDGRFSSEQQEVYIGTGCPPTVRPTSSPLSFSQPTLAPPVASPTLPPQLSPRPPTILSPPPSTTSPSTFTPTLSISTAVPTPASVVDLVSTPAPTAVVEVDPLPTFSTPTDRISQSPSVEADALPSFGTPTDRISQPPSIEVDALPSFGTPTDRISQPPSVGVNALPSFSTPTNRISQPPSVEVGALPSFNTPTNRISQPPSLEVGPLPSFSTPTNRISQSPVVAAPTPVSEVDPLPSFNTPTERMSTSPSNALSRSVNTDIEISITLRLDDRPQETGWSLTSDSTGVVVASAEAGKYTNATVTDMAVIMINENYLFCITDESRDGITDGTYSVSYRGWPLVLGDGDFGGEVCHGVEVTDQEIEDLEDMN